MNTKDEMEKHIKKWMEEEKSRFNTIAEKGLEILHQERRGQVNSTVMEHFNSILFHKSGPANKQQRKYDTTMVVSIVATASWHGIKQGNCLLLSSSRRVQNQMQ